jgi:hypothetical protein
VIDEFLCASAAHGRDRLPRLQQRLSRNSSWSGRSAAFVIEQLHRQLLDVAKRAGVTHGRRFRIDTTVVETNVHYPTGSSLLQDGMRVLTRTMQRASTALGDARGRVRNRLRSVGRRVLIIGRQARRRKRATRWSAVIAS